MEIKKGTKLKLRWQFLNEGEPVLLSDYSRFRLDVLDGKKVPQRTSVALSANEVVFDIDTAKYENGQYAVIVDADGADGGLHVCHRDAFRIVPSNAKSSLAKGGEGVDYELTIKVDMSGQLSTPSFSGSYNDLKDKPDLSKYYEKPSNGIPKNDMSSAVKSSLSKADSALQNESDPTVPQCVKDISQSDIDNWNSSSNPLPTGGSDGDVLVYRYGSAQWGSPYPDSGNDGDVLVRRYGSAQWESPQGGIPTGGMDGDVLVYRYGSAQWGSPYPDSGNDGDVLVRRYGSAQWGSPYPDSGNDGDVLVRRYGSAQWGSPYPDSGNDGDVLVRRYGSARWESPQGGIPSGGQPGQVLTIGPDGYPTWEYPQIPQY